jgi:hypothetical protein
MNLILNKLLLYFIFLVGCQSLPFNREKINFSRNNCTNTSNILKALFEEDQKERENFSSFKEEDYIRMGKRDEKRRQKIESIFKSGCLKSAKDFGYAAWIFQHGTKAEHFFQAFVWVKQAIKLGDDTKASLRNYIIDRYLVNIGYKQLFGTQAKKLDIRDECWCLYPTEPTFSDGERLKNKAEPISEQKKWLLHLNKNRSCPDKECAIDLKNVKKGEFPDFW